MVLGAVKNVATHTTRIHRHDNNDGAHHGAPCVHHQVHVRDMPQMMGGGGQRHVVAALQYPPSQAPTSSAAWLMSG